MDSIDVPPSPPPGDAIRPSPTGELVVLNGRQSGTRCPLVIPLTLLGRGDDCDVRLGGDAIRPWHCALVYGPGGWVVRDFPGHATLVNDEPLRPGRPLRDGDALAVGPFRFQLCLPAPAAAPVAEGSQDALRIQAAAVAAQQAALTEEEIRLQQRRTALEQQEQQLAAHLQEKRSRLLEVRDEARSERDALRKERGRYEARVAEVMRELAQSREELAGAQRQTQTQREHLVAFRRRLKQRWHRHWAAERGIMRRRQAEVDAQRLAVEQEAERLQGERAALGQLRLRLNGESELGRRQLDEAWDELYQAQQRYADQREREQADLRERQRALDRREAALAQEEGRLAEQQHHWEAARVRLEKEAEALDGRVRNHRRKLQELEQEVGRLEGALGGPVPPPGAAAPAPAGATAPARDPAAEERLAVLERMAGDLTDQRLHVAEQCQRLAAAEEAWQRERAGAVAELEAAARSLEAREQAVAGTEADLRQRHDEAAHRRRVLESWQARLVVDTAAWRGEREELLSDVQSREALVERRLAALVEVRRGWQGRRHQQVERLRADLAACEALRREWAGLRAECLRRRARLEQVDRSLAERALALEQYRQECIGQAANPRAAEKRLRRLRRRWEALAAVSEKERERQRRVLEAEAARLDEAQRRLQAQTAEILAREADLARRQAAWEEQRLLSEGEHAKLLQEMQSLRRQRQCSEQQIQEVRDEVERLVRLLLDEVGEYPSPSLDQAA
jgi:hypothetical protein